MSTADSAPVPATPKMIDWDFAVSVGTRLAGNGPEVSAEEAHRVVAELRDDAEKSTGYVREYTGLDAGSGTAPLLVVDRGGWIQANADGFASLLDPLTGKLADRMAEKQEKKGKKHTQPGPVAQAIGSRVTGAEIGGMFGFLGSKVLGQFDPFHEPAGRLLLVAPNIVHVERELDVLPADFRLWVTLHEETHRVQFTAVPWMREHLFGEMQTLIDSMEPGGLDDAVGRAISAIRGGKDGREGIVEAMSTPEQREVIDRVTAVMSLLEGHADVVMDGVGPSVIPTVGEIRRRFNQRRKGVGTLDRILRRLLGLDAKMAQYRDGAKFVRAVVDKVGMDDFNAVWAQPANLPGKDEIADPDAWVARVHG